MTKMNVADNGAGANCVEFSADARIIKCEIPGVIRRSGATIDRQ